MLIKNIIYNIVIIFWARGHNLHKFTTIHLYNMYGYNSDGKW